MEAQEPNKDVNAGANTEPVGTEKENKTTTFDDFLKGEGNQAEFDRRVQKAIETAKTKWQEINDAEKREAEKLAKMNKEQKLGSFCFRSLGSSLSGESGHLGTLWPQPVDSWIKVCK